MSFEFKNPNVSVPEGQLSKIIEIIENGGKAPDIFKAGIKTTKGTPVSERQARRYYNEVVELMQELNPDVLERFKEGKYNPDELFEDQDTAYPPVIAPDVKNRSCVFDIECLSPSFNMMGKYSHHLICASFYPFDTGEPYTLKLEFEENRDDRRLLRDIINELDKYTFVVGHNVKGYDLNWLLTRITFYGWKMPDTRLFYYDTLSALKRLPLKHRKGLGHAIDFFRIGDAEKTNVMPVAWDRIRSPYRKDFQKAMDEIVYHCENDVVANKRLYDIVYGMRYDPKPSWKLWPN